MLFILTLVKEVSRIHTRWYLCQTPLTKDPEFEMRRVVKQAHRVLIGRNAEGVWLARRQRHGRCIRSVSCYHSRFTTHYS